MDKKEITGSEVGLRWVIGFGIAVVSLVGLFILADYLHFHLPAWGVVVACLAFTEAVAKPIRSALSYLSYTWWMIWGSMIVCVAIPVYTGEALHALFCFLAWFFLFSLGNVIREEQAKISDGGTTKQLTPQCVAPQVIVKESNNGLLAATTLGFAMKSDSLESEKRALEAQVRDAEYEKDTLQSRVWELERSLARAESERDRLACHS